MKTINLEYFDLFPISTKQPNQRDILLAKAQGEPAPESITYNDPLEVLRVIIENDGLGPAHSAYEDVLRDSKVYKTWQKQMPYLKDVPNIHGFRNKKWHKIDVTEVNKEILSIGAYLPKGQMLYRGGNFQNREIHINDGPISTSLMPSVARWHAVEVMEEVAILRISEENSIKCYVYRSSGNQKHKKEYEVLLQSNIKLKSIREHNMGLRVVEYEVFANHAQEG